jgi:3-hydroxymyristoyl/3-hydroxydecanoyl-(acyl carrier protein) dehydratase
MEFRLVDRIGRWESRRVIRGVKNVSWEECRLREPLGYPAYLPESLILESLFQLVNWLVILSTDFQQACLGAQFDKAQFLSPLGPNRRMEMEVTVCGWRDDSAIVDGTVWDSGRTVVVVKRCLAAFVPIGDHFDPDHLRAIYSEIFRPEGPTRSLPTVVENDRRDSTR